MITSAIRQCCALVLVAAWPVFAQNTWETSYDRFLDAIEPLLRAGDNASFLRLVTVYGHSTVTWEGTMETVTVTSAGVDITMRMTVRSVVLAGGVVIPWSTMRMKSQPPNSDAWRRAVTGSKVGFRTIVAGQVIENNSPGTLSVATEGNAELLSTTGGTTVPVLRIVSGNNQSGVVNTTLPAPLVVELRDATSAPIRGRAVNFRANNGTLDATVALTDNNGLGQVRLTLGGAAGPVTVTVTTDPNLSVTFTATAVAAATVVPPAPGVIQTVAGGGGSTRDGVGATSVDLHIPQGLAIGPDGSLYIGDGTGTMVRRVGPDGIIRTITATDGRDGFPRDGIAVDPAGNIYLSDYFGGVVKKVTTDGRSSVVAGNGNASSAIGDGGAAVNANLRGPQGLALDAAGNLYIAQLVGNRVRKVTPQGVISTVAGTGIGGFSGDGGPAASAALNSPAALAFDKDGNLYIADRDNARLRKVTPNGTITTVAGNGVDGFGGDGGPALSAQIHAPSYLAVDAAGNVFLTDSEGGRVRAVTPQGTILTIAGTGTSGFSGDGGPALAAQFSNPGALAVDPQGNLYITDTFNHRIRRVGQPIFPSTLVTKASSFSIVNTASRTGQAVSPESLATLVGSGFASSVEGAADDTPVTELAGTGVTLAGEDGVERAARLLMVSPEQINLLVPFDATAGQMTVTVNPKEGKQQSATTRVDNSAPGLFSADGTGAGIAAGQYQLADADGTARFSGPLSRLDETQQKIVAIPIQMGPDPLRTIVTLAGTGFRFGVDVKVKAGGVDCTVVGVTPTATPGVDQVTFVLPRTLSGRGDVAVTLMSDVANSNPLTINIGQPLPLPRLASVTPNAVTAGDSSAVRITGTDLTGSMVRVEPPDGVSVTDVVVTATAITATLVLDRSLTAGSRSVYVVNGLGESNRLTLTVRPLPLVIRSVTPDSRQRGSDPFQIRIEGDNLGGVNALVFAPSTGITVSGVDAGASIVTATVQVTAAAALGRGTVAVRSATGVSNTLPFEVLAAPPPLPVITSIDPARVEVSQILTGFRVIGQNLGSSPQVSFDPSQGISEIGRSAGGDLFLQIGNDAAPGTRQVTVTTSAGRSNAVPLTIASRSGNFTISNLRTSGFTGNSFTVTVDFNDPSGSAASGVNYVIDFADLGFVSTSAVPQGTVTGRTSGTITISQQTFRSATRIGRVTINLVNPAGNRSNTLQGSF